MSGERRPVRASPSDPRFFGLPFGDGTVRRFELVAPTDDAARLADGLLAASGWHVHRVGRARAAHGPNGMLWAYRWRIGAQDPATGR